MRLGSESTQILSQELPRAVHSKVKAISTTSALEVETGIVYGCRLIPKDVLYDYGYGIIRGAYMGGPQMEVPPNDGCLQMMVYNGEPYCAV